MLINQKQASNRAFGRGARNHGKYSSRFMCFGVERDLLMCNGRDGFGGRSDCQFALDCSKYHIATGA